MSTNTHTNPYLEGSVPKVFFKTAFPIILIMLVNGLYTVIDAIFVGIYAGADALTAVTLTFPIFMLMVAVSSMVGAGMASLVARFLGANNLDDAKATFLSAHILAVVISATLAIIFTIIGPYILNKVAGGDETLAAIGYSYISILIYGSALMLLLSVQGDALRSEGRAGTMALLGVVSTLFNMVFNYLFIAQMGLGAAGSAIGTICAQVISFGFVIWLRRSGRTRLTMGLPKAGERTFLWGRIITLGLPPSLGFGGIALTSAMVIAVVRIWGGDNYPDTIAAYGIITRIMTFAFLPMLALNLAAQSMAGNNYGAGAFERSNQTVTIAVTGVVIYAAIFQIVLSTIPGAIGRLFVSDPAVVAEVERIMPIFTAAMVLGAPMMVLSGYYQALGIAWAAGILSLAKPYIISVALILLMPFIWGEVGIWYSIPAGDVLMLAVAALVLSRIARIHGARWGLYFSS